MRVAKRPALPLAPLLGAYTDAGPPTGAELGQLSGIGERVRAVLAAPSVFLNEAFLDSAGSTAFQGVLVDFYEQCVRPPVHADTLARRAGVVRHALGHLLRSPDPLPRKAERCLMPDGAYYVAGLGPVFWSALFQALDPLQNPSWTPAVIAGLRRLGLDNWSAEDAPARVYAGILDAYHRLLSAAPKLSALHLDHFLSLVSAMQGRDLWSGALHLDGSADLAAVVRQERARVPLRRRLKERGRALQQARLELKAGLSTGEAGHLQTAMTLADPSVGRSAVDWETHVEPLSLWAARLWETDDPYETLDAYWQTDPVPGGGLWLPAAVLHLRDPQQFHPWGEAVRQGYASLADGADAAGSPAERYRLFNEGVACLRRRHRLHPLEAPAVLAAAADEVAMPRGRSRGPALFGGFCADTFRFLEDLAVNNSRAWMNGQRERYHFAVREPLVELCRALAERYVEPVLHGKWAWEIETTARSGRALTSICKNDYGKSVPYHTELWVTFCRRGQGGKRNDVQLFVRLEATGLSFGLRLGRDAREAGRLFRRNVQEHAERLYHALAGSGALGECKFSHVEMLTDPVAVRGPGDLRTWAAGKSLVAGRFLPAGTATLATDALVGDILITFDRLLPAYACAVSSEPEALLSRRDGGRRLARYTEVDFCRATFLAADWPRRARTLLELKRQLILQGVPGTGKTHVARALARLLTGGRDEAVRLIQFHPAYSYEEFVEGIKVRSVEVGGRHDVTYPVEDGLLCRFAAEAARAPTEPHVLIIDEINRGNLPRIFGELLYLLEYRGQSVTLPYSKRDFRLPDNLYLLGTMNAADRSVTLIDHALRRRFSFLEMPPDAAVLSSWLRSAPPRDGPDFAARVVSLFNRLNAALARDVGSQYQVGHSYFMLPDLDQARLRVVWEHHVLPLLDEYFAGRTERLQGYTLDRLLQAAEPSPRRSARASG